MQRRGHLVPVLLHELRRVVDHLAGEVHHPERSLGARAAAAPRPRHREPVVALEGLAVALAEVEARPRLERGLLLREEEDETRELIVDTGELLHESRCWDFFCGYLP